MPRAKKIQVKQATSWSFSRYSDYQQCPLKFKLKHLDKIKEPPNPAMARGAEIHDKAEAYLRGKLSRLPTELKEFKQEFQMLRKLYKKKLSGMVVEDMWAFTNDWTETQWNDWAGCWVRIKLDCAHYEDDDTLIVTDWKTGKFRENKHQEYLEQLELYALATLLMLEHVEVVKPRLVYLDVGVTYPEEGEEFEFTRDDIPKLKRAWNKRVKPMMNDKVFAPKPNNLCNWCFYRSSNKANGGGQCKY